MVAVRRDRKEYQRIVHHSNGGHVTLTYKKAWQLLFFLMQLTIHVHIQVKPVNHPKWEQIDDNMHCDTVVAYLEDKMFGYIVREYFDNGMLFSL